MREVSKTHTGKDCERAPGQMRPGDRGGLLRASSLFRGSRGWCRRSGPRTRGWVPPNPRGVHHTHCCGWEPHDYPILGAALPPTLPGSGGIQHRGGAGGEVAAQPLPPAPQPAGAGARSRGQSDWKGKPPTHTLIRTLVGSLSTTVTN